MIGCMFGSGCDWRLGDGYCDVTLRFQTERSTGSESKVLNHQNREDRIVEFTRVFDVANYTLEQADRARKNRLQDRQITEFLLPYDQYTTTNTFIRGRTCLVSRYLPAALRHQLFRTLIDIRASGNNLILRTRISTTSQAPRNPATQSISTSKGVKNIRQSNPQTASPPQYSATSSANPSTPYRPDPSSPPHSSSPVPQTPQWL